MRNPFGIKKVLVSLILIAVALPAQDKSSWTYNAANEVRVISNVVYSTANGYDCKLDAYVHRDPKGPVPVVLFIHGGGWVAGTKEGATMALLPWLEKGLSVVNAEYRMARVSLAPAAVEDCRLALRWIFKNAKQYGFDTTRVIVTGTSAGGHLALMTGMLTASDGFDTPTDWDYATVEPKVAAIINWFGITDVKDLLSGPNKQNYAVNWIGDQPDKDALALRVSPLTYVRKGLPPVFSVQGDHDELVPYSHSVRLHEALTRAGVPNELLTIPGGKHGGFTKDETAKTYNAIFDFLKKQKILE